MFSTILTYQEISIILKKKFDTKLKWITISHYIATLAWNEKNLIYQNLFEDDIKNVLRSQIIRKGSLLIDLLMYLLDRFG